MNLEQIKTQYSSQILNLAKRRKVENVRIFGSVARGEENKKSDIDFLIHLSSNANLLDLSGFNLDLADLLNCKVDVVCDNSIHWSIRERILLEAVNI